jgi:hypothetical protein
MTEIDDEDEATLPVKTAIESDYSPEEGAQCTADEGDDLSHVAPEALVERLSRPSDSPLVSISAEVSSMPVERHFELPPCIDTMETTDNPSSIKLVVEARSTGCLDCTHLVSTGSTEYTKCHFSAGNTSCPAQSVKIVFVGRRNFFLEKLKAARAKGDPNAILRVMAALEVEPLDLKNFVLTNVGLL